MPVLPLLTGQASPTTGWVATGAVGKRAETAAMPSARKSHTAMSTAYSHSQSYRTGPPSRAPIQLDSLREALTGSVAKTRRSVHRKHIGSKCQLRECQYCVLNQQLDWFEFRNNGGNDFLYNYILEQHDRYKSAPAIEEDEVDPSDVFPQIVEDSKEIGSRKGSEEGLYNQNQDGERHSVISLGLSQPQEKKERAMSRSRSIAPTPLSTTNLGNSPTTSKSNSNRQSKSKKFGTTPKAVSPSTSTASSVKKQRLQQITSERKLLRKMMKDELKHFNAHQSSQGGGKTRSRQPAFQQPEPGVKDFLWQVRKLQDLRKECDIMGLTTVDADTVRKAFMSHPNVNMMDFSESKRMDSYGDQLHEREFKTVMREVYPLDVLDDDQIHTVFTCVQKENSPMVSMWEFLLIMDYLWRSLRLDDHQALLKHYYDMIHLQEARMKSFSVRTLMVRLLDVQMVLLLYKKKYPNPDDTGVANEIQDLFASAPWGSGQLMLHEFQEYISKHSLLQETFQCKGWQVIKSQWLQVQFSGGARARQSIYAI
eukprot:TRINITY_DN64543_c0_g1_i1.p1 TRINITY_DN64543_c0_g1~~TRINITY_DN64543_c0_g1_i1.p1  ORF type:complete len:537 (+),score=31.84 TRINITY_DN64543_c0_g1_i1:74-1684(+)